MPTRPAKIAEPKGLDELIDFVANTTRDHYEKTKRPIEGSLLASLFKYQYPGIELTKFGVVRFADLVRLAVERGVVERRPNVTHVELKPAENRPAPNVAATDKVSRRVCFVRPDIWRALVFSEPSAKIFIRKSDGTLETSPPAETGVRRRKDDGLIQIAPVTQAMQLDWLREFLAARGQEVPADEAVLLDMLRGGIKTLGMAITKDWRFLRSRKVVEYARHWAEQNGIDPKLVLEAASDEAKRKRTAQAEPQDFDQDALRKAVLAAVGEMPTSDLENLSIPLRYVLRHFKAR